MANLPYPEEGVSGRRAFLRRLALIGGGLSLSGLVVACGGSSKTATTTSPTSSIANQRASTTTTRAAASSSTAASSGTLSGTPFDQSLELAIDFSYVAASAGGRFHNPYIAVWLEDPKAVAVRTLALNVSLTREGSRYIQELRRWFRDYQSGLTSGATDVTTISSPTKIPGAYRYVWDGRNDKKEVVAQGDYFVCIEAAREQGPYEIIREQISIGAAPFKKQLTDNGELQGAVVELRKRA